MSDAYRAYALTALDPNIRSGKMATIYDVAGN